MDHQIGQLTLLTFTRVNFQNILIIKTDNYDYNKNVHAVMHSTRVHDSVVTDMRMLIIC